MVFKLTKLDAINEALSLVGIAEVADLSDPQRQDALKAQTTFDEVLHQVGTVNQFYNRYEEVELVPDSSNQIVIADDVFDVELYDSTDKVIPKRNADGNMRLYNKTKQTFEFTGNTKVYITYHLEFEDLPEVVKRYVIMVTARKLYLKLFGPSPHLQVLQAEEKMAYDTMQRWELDSTDANMLAHPDRLRVWSAPRRTGRNR